ncbi:response regulator [candidate division KSB3 bacterium]|uniref:Response regulator n=1 Tax=candidate division KSB3 bacterium TaxID=2044937 RepID=A0A9D5JSG4_9BACT|nr:response regulator [candidate division KSB3 bacterium]MBD3323424.1 response regulator [candidate division KSB3 bacterium]
MTEQPCKILVLDDEPDMAENLERILQSGGYETIVETDETKALALIEHEQPDLLLTDLRMPEIDGMTLLEQIKTRQWDIPVIMLTGYASVDSAVEAMKKGAADYLSKPFAPEELLLKIRKALDWDRLQQENRYLRERIEHQERSEGIIGQHPSLLNVLKMVKKVARTDSRVLLVGESGTGKELIAQTIHRQSSRRDKPFFAVNCGALTESILESELFGHERGAFTGAIATKKGIFEAAKGGTLFLDEIGETALSFQTKLLRVVEKEEFFRVGGTHPIKTDVRLIAATNQDLHQAIQNSRFREDLFYRLSVVQIHLPPLRERREDIPLLSAHFLGIHSQKIAKKVKGIHPDVMTMLMQYPWPGNIRELQNVIERAVIMVDPDHEIAPEHLPFNLLPEDIPTTEAAPPDSQAPAEALKMAEREIIINTLKACDWNRSLAAKKLGIGRRTLYDKLARLGISLKPNL